MEIRRIKEIKIGIKTQIERKAAKGSWGIERQKETIHSKEKSTWRK